MNGAKSTSVQENCSIYFSSSFSMIRLCSGSDKIWPSQFLKVIKLDKQS